MTTCIFLGTSSGISKSSGKPYFYINIGIPYSAPCMPLWKKGVGYEATSVSLRECEASANPSDFANFKPFDSIDMDIRNMNLKWTLLGYDLKSHKKQA